MQIVYTPNAVASDVIPESRSGKRCHRQRHWVANEVPDTVLDEMFPGVPWFCGLPRFMYRKAASDAWIYVRSLARRNPSDTFYYELQLLRFARLILEAARHGFRKPSSRELAGTLESHRP